VLPKNGLPRHTCNRIASVSICGHQRLICVISGNVKSAADLGFDFQ
jgi:hypothetical protein